MDNLAWIDVQAKRRPESQNGYYLVSASNFRLLEAVGTKKKKRNNNRKTLHLRWHTEGSPEKVGGCGRSVVLGQPKKQMVVAKVTGWSCRGWVLSLWGRANGSLDADSSRWLWSACLLVEAAAERFRPLRSGKRQPRTLIVADGCGLRAWSKLPRSVLGLWGRANGSLERR